MVATIKKKLPHKVPRGEYRARCDYCGSDYLRSELRKDGSQFLSCSWCNDVGHDVTTLDRKNTSRARRVDYPARTHDGTYSPFDVNEESEQIDTVRDKAQWGGDFEWGATGSLWGVYTFPDIGV